MAHGGYIIVKGEKKGDYRDFYGQSDRNREGRIVANKPTFTYGRRVDDLAEEVRSMEKALELGVVASDRRLEFELRYKGLKKKLDGIRDDETKANELLEKNKDAVYARFKELQEIISHGTPSKKDYKEGRVSPHKVLRDEKSGLGEMKKEYMILAAMLGEPSDTTLIQREGASPYHQYPYAMPAKADEPIMEEAGEEEPAPVVAKPVKKKAPARRKPAKKKPVKKVTTETPAPEV